MTRSAGAESTRVYRDLFSLTGRVIIVSGGTGHLGREISRGLAVFGARVIAVGRDERRFAELNGFKDSDSTGSIECRACDVTDDAAFTRLTAETWRAYGRIDGLINGAGAGKRETWEQLDKKGWLEGLEQGLNHYFTCTKAVSRYMLEAGRGTILNNASLWSFLAPDPRIYLDLNNGPAAHNPVAKGAILQLTKYLAALWAPRGIRVNALTPGWFPKKSAGPQRPDYIREITSRVPMERIGAPPDLVGAVVFLMSDASAYVTGHNLVVDGGYSVW